MRNDHPDAAKVLLDHGANVNDAAPDGTSALNMAVVNAYFDLASALIDEGVWLRPCFVNFRATEDDVLAILEVARELGERVAREGA